MHHSFILTLALLFSLLIAQAQQAFKGYPSHSITDLKKEFQKPSKSYGNIPFYLWEGDTLKKEHLLDQLNLLENEVNGFAVSYVHTHPGVAN